MKKETYNIPTTKWLSLMDEPLMAAESVGDIDEDDDTTEEAGKRGLFDEDEASAPRNVWGD